MPIWMRINLIFVLIYHEVDDRLFIEIAWQRLLIFALLSLFFWAFVSNLRFHTLV